LRCHWPFDAGYDEWIDIANDYHAARYSRAISDAIACGEGAVRGVAGGFLEVKVSAGGFTIEFSRPVSGWSASSLRLVIGRPVGDLLPQALPFTLTAGLNVGPVSAARAGLLG
jgi:hypothetical protein